MNEQKNPAGGPGISSKVQENYTNNSIKKQTYECKGAEKNEWGVFENLPGVLPDILPVVSNQDRKISPTSNMKVIGKTPSIINNNGHVVGIAKWTAHKTTQNNIETWRSNSDYGICVQTRATKAIDVDITDSEEAEAVVNAVYDFLEVKPPRRIRGNSSKCLLWFRLSANISKKTIKTQHGIIEFLGNGQHFVAAGTHTSGVRYQWEGGLPTEIPGVSEQKYNDVFQLLQVMFGVGAPSETKATEKHKVLSLAVDGDRTLQALSEQGRVISVGDNGKVNIICPWEDEHSSDTGPAATTYFPPHTGGYSNGNFKCLHAHCSGRNVHDLREVLGVTEDEVVDMFDDVSKEREGEEVKKTLDDRIIALNVVENPFDTFPHIVDMWIPQGEVTLLAGHGGSGKSYIAMLIAVHVALGMSFGKLQTVQAKVLFLSCEDTARVLQLRLTCICHDLQIDQTQLKDKLFIIDASDIDPALYREQQRLAGLKNKSHKNAQTPLLGSLSEFARRKNTGLVVVDNASDTFDGDEIKRSSVRTFIRSLRSCIAHPNRAVLLLAHVNKISAGNQNISTENYSGSTAWHNSVRSRLSLISSKKKNRMTMQHDKANLGERAEPMEFEWYNGVPVIICKTTIGRSEDKEENSANKNAIVELIQDFDERNERVTTSIQGSTTVYKLLSTHPQFPKHIDKDHLTNLLRELEKDKRVYRREVKTPDRKLRQVFTCKKEPESAPIPPSMDR